MTGKFDRDEFVSKVPPEVMEKAIASITGWRDLRRTYFDDAGAEGVDSRMIEGSLMGLDLQAHLRVEIMAFSLCYPPEKQSLIANATLTALAHCIGLILAEGEARGFDRGTGLVHIIDRINGVIDDELEADRHAGQ